MAVCKPRRPKPTKKTLAVLRMAIKFFGGENKDLAEAIGVSRTLVGDWCSAKHSVSLRCAILIEKKTKGAISAIELIPDIK